MAKNSSALTAKLTPENWQDKINLDTLSLDDLTDLMGDFKSMKAFATQLEGFLKQAIAARMPEGQDEYMGPHYVVNLNHRVRAGSLDRELILEEMGEEWVAGHSKKPTEYVEMRVKRREPDEVE